MTALQCQSLDLVVEQCCDESALLLSAPRRRRYLLAPAVVVWCGCVPVFFCHVCYRPGLRGSRQPRRALGRSAARPSHSGWLGWLPSAGLLQLTRSAPGYTPQQ